MVSLKVALLLAASIAGEPDIALLDFYADWCGPCQQMNPIVEGLAARGVPIQKVNVEEHRELVSRYNIGGIPCFVLVVNGQEAGRVVGATSASELENLYQQGLAKLQPASGPAPWSPTESAPLDLRPVVQQTAPQPTSSNPPSAASFNNQLDANGPAAVASANTAARPPVTDGQLIASSVRLRIQDPDGHSVGAGTIIDSRSGEALVLTCGHVFRDSAGKGEVTVDMFGPNAATEIPGRVLAYDLDRDLGLISFRPPTPVNAARIASPQRAIQVGDAVVSVGCDHGDDATARRSQLIGINRFLGPENFEVAGQPVQGRSGGGLFSQDGALIGVCNAADPSEDQGLYAAIPSVHAWLQERGLLEFCLESTEQNPSNAAFAAQVATGDSSRAASTTLAPFTPEAELGNQLASQQSAALDAMRNAPPEAEVICIVRSLTDPRAKSEIIILDKATPDFLRQLTAERNVQNGRQLTAAHSQNAPQSMRSADGRASATTATLPGPAMR